MMMTSKILLIMEIWGIIVWSQQKQNYLICSATAAAASTDSPAVPVVSAVDGEVSFYSTKHQHFSTKQKSLFTL